MALEKLSGSTFIKSTDTPVGSSFSGYLVGFDNSGKFPNVFKLKMVMDDGREVMINPHGNLRYFKENLDKGGWPLGCYYIFTRMDDRKSKDGTKMVPHFEYAMDREKTLTSKSAEVVPPVAAATTPTDLPF